MGRFTQQWYLSIGVMGGPKKLRLVGIVADSTQWVLLVWVISATCGSAMTSG